MGLYVWAMEKVIGAQDYHDSIARASAGDNPALKHIVYLSAAGSAALSAVIARPAVEHVVHSGEWATWAVDLQLGFAAVAGAMAIDAFNQARKIGHAQADSRQE